MIWEEERVVFELVTEVYFSIAVKTILLTLVRFTPIPTASVAARIA